MTTAMAVFAPVVRPCEPPFPLLLEPPFDRAAGVEEDAVDEVAVDEAETGTMAVEPGLLRVTTTVTGLVSVMPLLVADCVITLVMTFVVGGTEEADTTEVTTSVEDAGMVVVESSAEVLRMEEETSEAMEEEIC
jgi:hypothetical protein